MKVIVCGAGQVGAQLARRLAEDGADVTIVDHDANLVREITDEYDVGGVAGHAAHPGVLERAGATDADMLIAATHLDEVNMVACQVAHSVFSVPQKIARVRAQSYLDPLWSDLFRREHMPIDVIISPELEVARVALDRIDASAAFDTETFLEGAATLIGLNVDENCPVINTPLRQLSELFEGLDAIVVGIRREGRLRSAAADDQVFDGDEIYLVARSQHTARAIKLFGRDNAEAHRVVVIGLGNVGLSVAQMLEKRSGVRVKAIERNRERAEIAADGLDRTIVLHGDALDPEILLEASADRADAVIALTDDDRVNLLACALAKRSGARLAIALANDSGFAGLAEPLGIDAFVNPRATTVSTILRHVRRGKVRAVYSLGEGEAEVIEAQVLATSPIAGKRLRDAGFPSGAVVGAVLSSGGMRRPTGDLLLSEGDVLVVFAMRDVVREVERLFRVAVEFF